ncbi:MAG: DUF5615 family PIN-like protein [Bifidobacteriaceae bacterium]|jgi:hypothetical protein|nr:DUF5615 family PIN-like protein [Bifidobacteriaceae bacterium]
MLEILLLLDEHYPRSLADQLMDRGVNTQAVVARPDLRGTADATVLSAARQEGRMVVTADVTTFPAAMTRMPDRTGVVFCDSGRFPRTISALPRLADALFCFASDPPPSAALPGFVWWFQRPPDR